MFNVPKTGQLTQPVDRFSTSTWRSLYTSSTFGPDWKTTLDTLFCKQKAVTITGSQSSSFACKSVSWRYGQFLYSPPSPYNYQCECKSFLEMTEGHKLW